MRAQIKTVLHPLPHKGGELHSLRALRAPCLALVERVLAAQGDHAEPDLIQLQHALVAAGARTNPPKRNNR